MILKKTSIGRGLLYAAGAVLIAQIVPQLV
jgi:hypothetical protein